eukprot:TRINITY_DN2954_c0_g1_i1.p1 TRINITY_DN2954_c0_g1~~TRINITY_DN2954_c0_g1_i1.p1  ORF type:complete len:102 (-),score=41.34 TRINITY_DN2954_c0_g1_i1:123-428(-)
MKAAMSGGSKGKKKKWSKGKTREKLNNAVTFNQATYDKLFKEIPPARLITQSSISERLKVNGSLARRAIRELVNQGLIRQVSVHHSQNIFTRNTAAAEDAE